MSPQAHTNAKTAYIIKQSIELWKIIIDYTKRKRREEREKEKKKGKSIFVK